MVTHTTNPVTALTWGRFLEAAYGQVVNDPAESNASTLKNMPSGYTLMRTIPMADLFGNAT